MFRPISSRLPPPSKEAIICVEPNSLPFALFQESRKNQLRDFVDIAGPLGVSHFLILTATDNAAYLRVAKTPRVRREPCSYN